MGQARDQRPRLQRCEMENCEKFFGISPNTGELESSQSGEGAEAFDGVFVGKFCNDFLAGDEMEFAFTKMEGLRTRADQMHLDAVRLLVVDGAMPPLHEIEIGAQLAVGALQ